MEKSTHSITAVTKYAWVTLLTRPSYLPGAVLLAHSLHKQNSRYPLLILVTPSFPKSILPTLEQECLLTNSQIIKISSLAPLPENTPKSLIAARFEDTWTKLRVFELYRNGFEKLVFLDADILILRNMDELFDLPLPRNWIAANHACVCNLDKDSWAPEDWIKDNCAFTGITAESNATPVPDFTRGEKGKRTHTLLNSGVFIFTPHESQWEEMLKFLNTDGRVKTYMFPDQDFLADFFEGRWKSLEWKYNALKTMRYWHTNIWDEKEVRALHYIVDKPWSHRVDENGVAGYLGHDGITHSWWWKEYESWEAERRDAPGVVEMMRKEVAKPLN